MIILGGDRTIIGADTLVIINGAKLGKPKSKEEAIKMLKKIQGKKHTVYTGLAILIEEKGKYKEYKELSKTDVFVNNMTDEEIEQYIDEEMPFDKAGAYAIQGRFSVFINRIEGEYATVIGLPISRIYQVLKKNQII